MMNILKGIGTDLLLYGGLALLALLYIAGVRKDGKTQGKLITKLENLESERYTRKKHSQARREFGANIQDLEEDDNVQYFKKPFGKVKGDGSIHVDLDDDSVQFQASPFNRNR